MPRAKKKARIGCHGILASLGFLAFATGLPAQDGSFLTGDVTSLLGPGFFVDDATLGGSDTDINQPATGVYLRRFNGLLVPNQGPTRVAITGLGFATHTSASANDATSIGLTFTYLGADEAVGGGDDVVVGSVTGSFSFVSGSEYAFAFTNPLTADLNITGTRFRIQVAPSNATNNGSLKLKTAALASEPSLTGVKLSVAGAASPLINPGRVNLAKFQPVTVSSVSGQRIADYVTDGHTGNDNRWQSANSAWSSARVDFPFPVEVGSAQVFSGVDDTTPVATFNVQYLDGNTWTTIPEAAVSGNTDVERNLVFTNPVTASSFRLIGQDAPLRIREFALYPPNGPAGFPLGTDLTVNLAYQRPVVASSHVPGNFPMKAVDGRVHTGSFWQTTAPGNHTLDIDLRVMTKIGSVHLYSGSPGVAPLADFTLSFWDGAAWQAIPGATITGNTSAERVLSFTPLATTSIRLGFTNPGTVTIRELMVFPANTGNGGYPLGTNAIDSGAVGNYDLYHDAFHQIRNPDSNRFLTVPAGGQPALDAAGLAVERGHYQVLLNLSNGTYRLRNRFTGNCLAGAGLSKVPGLALTDEPYRALPHQDWILNPMGSGSFQFVNQWSGLAIDTLGGASSSGTPLIQNSATGSTTQRWQVVYAEKYPKKGIGGALFAGPTGSKWVYTWGLVPPAVLPAAAPFYPMQWGNFAWDIGSTQGPNWQHYPTWRRRGDGVHLLGFNEPDRYDQAGKSMDPANPTSEAAFDPNRTIATAVTLWPRLQAMDLPLVSPVPASTSSNWFPDFYSQSDNLGYRVDYTAVHLYPGPSGGSASGLIASLQSAYNNWGRPVWLTEFSFVDWGKNQSWSEEDNYQALAEFLWRAESLPWLRKYALFVFTENSEWPQPPNPWQNVTPAPRSNSYDINGNLTAFGKLYAGWDNDTTIRTNKTYYIHHKASHKRIANLTTQSNLAGRNIRVDGPLVSWSLVSAGPANRYYVVSALDGRRLGTDGTTVSLSAAGTTGSAVEWSLTESQHGWFYLGHPASAKRLNLVYNNSNFVATYTMVANTTTGDAAQWRFIRPPPAPVWTGLDGNSWTNHRTWTPDMPSSSADVVTFNNQSLANLETFLDQDFHINGLVVADPAGPVTIGGGQTLTLGNGGIDLSSAERDLTINAPVALAAAQAWMVASGRTLAVNGGLGGAFALTFSGQGGVSLGGPVQPAASITVAADATLRTTASSVLASGPDTGNVALDGTLDLWGTNQSVNFITGGGFIDNSASGPASLTVGGNNTGGTLGAVLRDTGGPLGLVKIGSASLILPAANTHEGGFTNQGTGSIFLQHAVAFGTGTVIMNGATLYATPGNFTFENPLTLNGANLRVGGGNNRTLTWNGPVTVTGSAAMVADGGTSGVVINGPLDITNSNFTSSGNGNLNALNGTVTGAGGNLSVTGANAILQISGSAEHGGTTMIGDNAFLRLTANGTLPTAGTIFIEGSLTIRNTAGWTHAGTIGGDGTGVINLNTGTNATLAGPINGVAAINVNNAGTDATINGVIGGASSITVQNSVDGVGNGAILRLGGANTYTGATTVQRGRLVLAASGVLPSNSPVNIGNATLDAGSFANAAGPLDLTGPATLLLGTGGSLAFADSSAIDWSNGTLTINGTFVPGSSIRFGTGPTSLTGDQLARISVAGFPGPYLLNAGGFLTISLPHSYEAWQTTNATNGGFSDDHDNDGVPNGIEHFLSGSSNTTGYTVLPGIDTENRTITWTMAATYEGEYGVDFVVETSATMEGAWVEVPMGPGVGEVAVSGEDVRYTFPEGTTLFVRLKVIGP